jgi:hypothetical protein
MIYCLECVGEGARQFLKFGSIAKIPIVDFPENLSTHILCS